MTDENLVSTAPLQALFVGLSLALAIGIYIVAWMGVAAWLDGFHGWMALLATPTVIAVLRLSRVPTGAARGVLAAIATLAAITLANWIVVAIPFADSSGLTPLATAMRIGPHFLWTLLRLAHSPLDWFWTALSPALAAWWGWRDAAGLSARRPAP